MATTEQPALEFVQEIPPLKPRGGGTGTRAPKPPPPWLDALRLRVGDWAIIATYGTRNTAGSASTRFRKKYGAEGFEFVARVDANEVAHVYARFVGA